MKRLFLIQFSCERGKDVMKVRILVVGFMIVLLWAWGISQAQENNSIRLRSFSADILADSSFLEQEAGISAYGQVSIVDLDLAENVFKNVEKKTSEYIIGSVALDDYDEPDDVHVYVDISGWMIAYYLKEEKASKIIDWVDYLGGEITSTKLSDALVKVAAEMNAFLPEVNYYDFRWPNATNIMIITDEEIVDNATQTFRVKVPVGYTVYDRTWSHAIKDVGSQSTSGNIKIDDELLNSGSSSNGWVIWEGDITPLQLVANEFHEISLYHNEYGGDDYSYVGVVLIYSGP